MPRKEDREAQAAERAQLAADLERAGHVRIPPGRESTVKERVEYIIAAMSDCTWNGFASRAPLVELWGVTDSTIRNYSAEAWRALKLDPQGLAEHRQALASWVSKQRERAASMVNENTGLPDWSGARGWTELECKLLDIEIDTKRVEMTGKDGGPISVTLDDIDTALKTAAENAAPDADRESSKDEG
jgi:hypothetical protein